MDMHFWVFAWTGNIMLEPNKAQAFRDFFVVTLHRVARILVDVIYAPVFFRASKWIKRLYPCSF